MFRTSGYFTINVWHNVKVVKRVFYISMSHIAHKVREHCVYILSITKLPVHICINKMMPKIICANAYSGIFLFWKGRIPEPQKVFFKHSSTIRFISPIREKHPAFWEQAADMPVINIQIFYKISGNIDPPAFETFGLKDIKIAFIQIHIFSGKYAHFLTAEATTVQKTEHSR